jgi:ferritin-like metal-binding protein YciE
MSIFSKELSDMDDLFVHTLRDIYYAEGRIAETMPRMIDKATDLELRSSLQHHLDETRNHITRLKRVFELHGAAAKGVRCPAIDGIIAEAEEIVGETADSAVMDAAIVASAQAIEHYEITRYGTLIAWAKELGRDDCAAILDETLREEYAADGKLTDIAEARVNRLAA